MEEHITDRIIWIRNHYEVTPRAFDLSIGKSNGYIDKQHKRKGSVGSEALQKILDRYTDISPQWLIVGEGPKLRSENAVLEYREDYQTLDPFEKMLLDYLDRPAIAEKIMKLINHERS